MESLHQQIGTLLNVVLFETSGHVDCQFSAFELLYYRHFCYLNHWLIFSTIVLLNCQLLMLKIQFINLSLFKRCLSELIQDSFKKLVKFSLFIIIEQGSFKLRKQSRSEYMEDDYPNEGPTAILACQKIHLIITWIDHSFTMF